MGSFQNLQVLTGEKNLQMAVLAFIANQLLDKAERERLSDLFVLLDRNSDG